MEIGSPVCWLAWLHVRHLQTCLPDPVGSLLPQACSCGARSMGAVAEWPGMMALLPHPAAARQPLAGVARESVMEPEDLFGGCGSLAMRSNGTWSGRRASGATKPAAVPEVIVPAVIRIRQVHADDGSAVGARCSNRFCPWHHHPSLSESSLGRELLLSSPVAAVPSDMVVGAVLFTCPPLRSRCGPSCLHEPGRAKKWYVAYHAWLYQWNSQ